MASSVAGGGASKAHIAAAVHYNAVVVGQQRAYLQHERRLFTIQTALNTPNPPPPARPGFSVRSRQPHYQHPVLAQVQTVDTAPYAAADGSTAADQINSAGYMNRMAAAVGSASACVAPLHLDRPPPAPVTVLRTATTVLSTPVSAALASQSSAAAAAAASALMPPPPPKLPAASAATTAAATKVDSAAASAAIAAAVAAAAAAVAAVPLPPLPPSPVRGASTTAATSAPATPTASAAAPVAPSTATPTPASSASAGDASIPSTTSTGAAANTPTPAATAPRAPPATPPKRKSLLLSEIEDSAAYRNKTGEPNVNAPRQMRLAAIASLPDVNHSANSAAAAAASSAAASASTADAWWRPKKRRNWESQIGGAGSTVSSAGTSVESELASLAERASPFDL